MLEITGNDVKGLNDTDLRSLVGLLCEAELRSYGLSTAGVTWGGHWVFPTIKNVAKFPYAIILSGEIPT